jgi:hypothetical protein
VAHRTRFQKVGGVGHLVEESVHALSVVAGQHQVHVQDQREDHAPAIHPPRHHLAQPGSEAAGEADGDHGGEQPVEVDGVQVAIEALEVDALRRRGTASPAVVPVPHRGGVVAHAQ